MSNANQRGVANEKLQKENCRRYSEKESLRERKKQNIAMSEIDPSIAAAALGLGSNDLVNDVKTVGCLFETLWVRTFAFLPMR